MVKVNKYDWSDLFKSGADVLKNGTIDSSIARDRWEACSDCIHLTESNRCDQCGCFMKMKVKVQRATCPIGIW